MMKFLRTQKRKYPGYFHCSGQKELLLSLMIFLGLASTGAAQSENGKNNDPYQRSIGASVSATNWFSGDQLRSYHPTDLLKALQIAEPSVAVIDWMQQNGSDPNGIPERIGIRETKGIPGTIAGKETALPLIIVDGYEISVDRLFDFDIRRVKSAAVLKDASVTAIYGIKAGNGVIMITTHDPQSGKIRLRYNFDGGIQTADLSSYHLMNAFEKLELEKNAGMYEQNQALYDERLGNVRQNGSTDWLKAPLQKPFNHKHRLEVEGGDKNMLYRVYLMAAPQNRGVMKGSERNLYTASTRFEYATEKFRVSDELWIDMNSGTQSPYGIFGDYARINPYYQKSGNRGVATMLLGEGSINPQYSPYYEGTLQSFFKQKATRVLNSLKASWNITESFHLTGSFTLSKDYNKYDQYISPNSHQFLGLPIDQMDLKGSYQIVRDNKTVYEESLMADYKISTNKHSLQALLGMHAYAATTYSDNYTGVGIANDHMNYISFAKKFAYNVSPGGREYYHRTLSGLASVAYDYDNRYAVDLMGRVDKSSRLAPDKRVACSWEATASWNITNEKWLKDNTVVNRLVIRAGAGTNNGYQFDYDQVNPVYGYEINNAYLNSADKKIGLVTLGQINTYNRGLKWRSDRNYNIGIALSVLDRLTIDLKYYRTLSDNLFTYRKTDMITGAGEEPVNDGSIRNDGVEMALSLAILKNTQGVSLNFIANGLANKNKLVSAPEYFLTRYNEAQAIQQGYFTQQQAGKPIDAVYAVESAGIDPANGREIFIGQDGQKTTSPGIKDWVYRGSMTPKLSGSFGLNGSYRNWQLSCMFRYSLGGTYYNYNKAVRVDAGNINGNGPKEMEQKWQETGELSAYQGFGASAGIPSSRFVETRNMLTLSSLHIGYQFNTEFIKKICMKDLSLGISCNDLFYKSSIEMERGWIYPYARNFTLSLQATF